MKRRQFNSRQIGVEHPQIPQEAAATYVVPENRSMMVAVDDNKEILVGGPEVDEIGNQLFSCLPAVETVEVETGE